eukprot:SAG31_NODE_255_length_19039_cov_83.461774_19_plen_211_part_00
MDRVLVPVQSKILQVYSISLIMYKGRRMDHSRDSYKINLDSNKRRSETFFFFFLSRRAGSGERHCQGTVSFLQQQIADMSNFPALVALNHGVYLLCGGSYQAIESLSLLQHISSHLFSLTNSNDRPSINRSPLINYIIQYPMQYYYNKLISIPVPGESVESLVVVPFHTRGIHPAAARAWSSLPSGHQSSASMDSSTSRSDCRPAASFRS